MTHVRDWNAASYARTAAPVEGFGHRLLDRLELRGDESVLDAGCGTGGVTEELLARVPEGRVIAVDGSPSMVERARERLGGARGCARGRPARARARRARGRRLSSATFHWIADHDRLFARLFAALKPGGRLLAQCGGAGNITTVVRGARRGAAESPFAEHFAGWRGPWNYAGPEETVARLERAGFVDAEAGLHDEPVQPEDPREYFETIMLGSHLERVPDQQRGPFVDRVLALLDEPVTVDYVRLTMSARRPGPA